MSVYKLLPALLLLMNGAILDDGDVPKLPFGVVTHLKVCLNPNSPRSLWQIADAPEPDVDLAQTYPSFPDKGKLVDKMRFTLMAAKSGYTVGEQVHIVHVFEAPDGGVWIPGADAKPVLDEYVDDKLATPAGPNKDFYISGSMSRRYDFRYIVTIYTFKRPGIHTISWRPLNYDGSTPRVSNTIRINVIDSSGAK